MQPIELELCPYNGSRGRTMFPNTRPSDLSRAIITYRGAAPPAVIATGSRIRFVGALRTYGVGLRASF